MAIATLTNTPTVIDTMDTSTNLTGDTFVEDDVVKIQGLFSQSCILSTDGVNEVQANGSWDLTAGEHLRLWINAPVLAVYGATEANDGMQIYITDGTNTAYWTVAGSDTYGGGWKQFVVYTGSTPTSGTVPTGNTTQVGIRINTASRPKNALNFWMDFWTYGDGYTVTGGTNGDEISWTEIALADYLGSWGITSLAGDTDNIFLTSGKVTIGNGATTTYFKDEGQLMNFKNLPVLSTLYELIFEGSGCNVNISGGAYSASGTQTYAFDASDSTIAFIMSGKQLSKARTVEFASGQTVTSNSFIGCGLISPWTATFTSNTVADSTQTSSYALFMVASHNISKTIYTNNYWAFACTPVSDGAEYDEIDGVFSGNTADVYNTHSTFELVINASGSGVSTSATAGGLVTINNSVTFKFTNVVSGSNMYAYNVTDSEVLIAPVEITTDPWQVTVPANKDYWFKLAKGSASPFYDTILESGNTGSGIDRRIEQIEN